MSVVTTVPAVRRRLHELLTAQFVADDLLQVIVGLPLADNELQGQVVSVGATHPADVEVDWDNLGNYGRHERYSVGLEVQVHLPDEVDPLAAEDRLGEVVTGVYQAVNQPGADLAGLRGTLGVQKLIVVVTGSDPRTLPLKTGGFLGEAAVRVSVDATVPAR